MNELRTAVLLGGTSAVVLLVGSLFGRAGLSIAVLVALGVCGYAWFHSDTIALRAMHARPVTETEAPVMHRIVRELSRVARQPVPRLYISPTAAPHAFATGRGPRHAAVCACSTFSTSASCVRCSPTSCPTVHHRDVVISSVSGALASMVTFLATAALFNGVSGDSDEPNPVAVVLIAVLGPVAAGVRTWR